MHRQFVHPTQFLPQPFFKLAERRKATAHDHILQFLPENNIISLRSFTSQRSCIPTTRLWKLKTDRVNGSSTGALRQLDIFAMNPDWLTVLFTSVVIGRNNYFGFGATTRD